MREASVGDVWWWRAQVRNKGGRGCVCIGVLILQVLSFLIFIWRAEEYVYVRVCVCVCVSALICPSFHVPKLYFSRPGCG